MKGRASFGFGVSVVLVLASIGCGGRERRIVELSLSFMTKDPDLNAFRVDEAAMLIRLRAFSMGMSVDEMKQLLGAPTFVWDGTAEGAEPDPDCDRQYVYRLDDIRNLRADFADGKLRRLVREVKAPPENGGGTFDVRLPQKAR